jgi:hypothetical protein
MKKIQVYSNKGIDRLQRVDTWPPQGVGWDHYKENHFYVFACTVHMHGKDRPCITGERCDSRPLVIEGDFTGW